MNDDQKRFRCLIMGSHSRLIQCGDILFEKGQEIVGIISAEPAIERWASEKELTLINPDADWVGILRNEVFDLFLSIDNFCKVPHEVLDLARSFAINFHDGPLPRYAGSNVTNWAIMNQEVTHGVTWHVMSDRIDSGDILKQAVFSVSPKETAYTLNAKCYGRSIQCFGELLDELIEGRVTPISQDVNDRTFYGRWKRPPENCTIDWTWSAKAIDALFRGLDYGVYENPLGVPKLYLGGRVVLVKGSEILESSESMAAGTITFADGEKLRVATKTHQLQLRGFTSFEGASLSPDVFLGEAGLRVGNQLPRLEQDNLDRITTIHSELCRHEGFWIERLRRSELIEIPYRKRQATNRSRYVEAHFSVPDHVLMSPDICKSPGDCILAAAILYFGRLTNKGTFDVDFRDTELSEKLSGTETFFCSQIPLHVEIEPQNCFRECREKITEQLQLVRTHGSYARDLLVRDPRLCDVLSQRIGCLAPLALERVEFLSHQNPTARADLVVVIPDNGKECVWWYDTEVYSSIAIDQMFEQFAVFLNGIADGQDRVVAELPILPEGQRRRILYEWNATDADYPEGICFHELFELQVSRSPEAVAISFDKSDITYRDLNKRANQLAYYLRGMGVGPDSLVGVCMERSLEMVVALYGVLKAGGAYVPIDPEYPEERIAFMLEDAQVPVLLSQRSVAEQLPQGDWRLVCLDTDWDQIGRGNTTNPPRTVSADNLAYMIYTSGSTGRPKGAMNTHGGISNRLLWMQDRYSLSESDTVLQKTPFSFDVSVWEFFWPLLVGARLVLAQPGSHRDAGYLVELIKKEQVTVMHFVPPMLQAFLEQPGVEGCVSLRHVICSGEALPYDLQQKFFERLPSELHNLYGPTEAAVDVTHWTCERGGSREVVPIGRPVANTQIYILDQQLQPVPVGVPGGLYIGGVQVGRGYHNRPELTAEKFVPNLFVPGARMYRTGDLGRYLSDGNIEYLGRIDHQVKIRGFRIELGEVEATLAQHAGVREAVVVAREYEGGDKHLVAYYTATSDIGVNAEELRSHLSGKLPEYMVPAAYVRLESVPLTANGKVDRKALPLPKVDAYVVRGYEAPEGEIEEALAGIWAEVLKLERVGRHDNFFDLGGHSLLAVRLTSAIQRELGVNIGLVMLFVNPTIEELALALEEKALESISKR